MLKLNVFPLTGIETEQLEYSDISGYEEPPLLKFNTVSAPALFTKCNLPSYPT